jgi:TonB-linked SusC/RagA family outer membrane protein
MSNFTRLALPKRGKNLLRRLSYKILLAAAAVSLGSWAFQDGEEKVTIKGNDVPLAAIFKTIKKQTGYSFFYAADYVNDKEKVSVDVKNVRVDDVLRRVLGKDYVWVYNENSVSITKKKDETRKARLTFAAIDSSVTQITVTGLVTDNKGHPIPGATVVVKGTKDGVNTDENGKFSLDGLLPNAVLVISSIGFEKREIQIKGKTILTRLNESVNDLDETVVVAYSTTTQRANTGAVAVVKGEQVQTLPNRSFDRSLQGLVPGLLVTSGNGQPGGGVSNMVLRGISTGTEAVGGSTVRNPLIVIDGVPVTQDHAQFRSIGYYSTPINNPLAQLNPSDIETISVLKDAAAIALYGSKASNGVILVTTKKGGMGRPVFSFRHQTDIATRPKDKLEVLNQEEYLELLFEAYKNTDPVLWTDQAIRNDLKEKFPYQVSSSGDTMFYSAPNWLDNLYRNNAYTITNEMSMSGGNEKNRYYMNLEHMTQNGIAKGTGYKRTSLRFNFENKPFNWLKVGLNTTMSYNVQDYTNPVESFTTIGLASVMSPLNPIRLNDGSYIYNYEYGSVQRIVANPVAAAEYNLNRNTAYRGLSKIFVEGNFFKYFKLATNLGVDFALSESKEKTDARLAGVSLAVGSGRIEEWDSRTANIITTNTLSFDRTFGNRHSLNLIMGQEAQILNQRILRLSVEDLSLPADQINSGNTVQSFTGYVTKESLLSWFAQAGYNFKHKYFLSTSFRRDGSSKFGDRQRFGSYWSTGVGWEVTSEPFMRQVHSWLNYLKIRASIGAAGSSAAINAITRYDELIASGYLGNVAVYPEKPGNPDIRWEQTFTWDWGIEGRLFKDRIILTADVYRRKTSDLVYTINLAPVTGYTNVLDNIGDMLNTGVEISLSSYIIRNGRFQWNVNGNWSTNRNKLVKANVALETLRFGQLANKEGENFNSFYLVRWAGVDPADGKPQWLDEKGGVTKEYKSSNRVFVGKPQPDGFGTITNAFSFGNFEFSLLLYYQYGFKIYDGALSRPLLSDGTYPYTNQAKQALNRWQKPGDIADNPRRMLNNTDGGDRASTRYLFDGDYIRLKNVTLSYGFPQRILDKVGLRMIKVYLQANNLFLLSKFKGQDPDNVNVGGAMEFPYPIQKSYSIGLNCNF